MNDNVNNPQHYQFSNGAQVIDITENLNFNRGNVVKYVARAGRKLPAFELEDLRKAKFYLDREIERLEAGEGKIEPVNPFQALLELERERRWNILFGEEILPEGLREEVGPIWVDEDGDEWRWLDKDSLDAGWGYRTPSVTGWIPVQGFPSEDYGPYKEKNV